MPVLVNAHADSLGPGVLTDLQFEDEGAARPEKARASTPQQASQTVRILCSLTSDPQLVGLNSFQSAFDCIYILIVCFSLPALHLYAASFSSKQY